MHNIKEGFKLLCILPCCQSYFSPLHILPGDFLSQTASSMNMNHSSTCTGLCFQASLVPTLFRAHTEWNRAMQGGLAHEIFYVPQRPYVMLGTLQDQLIYPLQCSGALARKSCC